MALVTNNAEGGSNGTVVTTTNSDGSSGTAFQAVTGGIATYSNATVAHGNLSYAFTIAENATGYASLADGTTTSADFSTTVYVCFPTAPVATHRFITVTNAARSAYVVAAQVTTTGTVELVNAAGFIATMAGSPLQVGVWYRMSFRGTVGTTGSLYATIYQGDLTAVHSSYSSSSRNMGTEQAALLAVGKFIATPNVSTLYVDDLKLNIGSSAEIGPVVATSTMQPNAGPDMIVEPGETGWLLARGYNTATSTYVKTGIWSQVSGPAVTLTPTTSSDGISLASFVAPRSSSTQTLVFRLTMTDAGGISVFDETTVTIPPWQSWSWNGTSLTPTG